MNNNENNGFNYTYSAGEQAELKKIRDKYLADTKPAEPDKMAQIRRLDSGVTQKATTIALIFGIMGALVMGFGMSLIMTDIKEFLGLHGDMAMILGIIIGVAGMISIIVAYPIYQLIVTKERKKIAPEIIRLTEELMK